MTFGVCAWSFAGVLRGNRPLLELADAAHRAGFSRLEAAFWSRREPTSDPTAKASLSVPVSSLATLELHRLFLTEVRRERREQAVVVVRRMIACAAELGMKTVSFSPGPWPVGDDRPTVLERLAQTLAPLVEEADGLGVRVALENLPGSCVAQLESMSEVLRRVPRLGLCLDIGNTLVAAPPAAWFDALGDRLLKLHLSDGIVEGEAFASRVPAEGRVAWSDVRPLLSSVPSTIETFVEAPLPAGADEASFLAHVQRSTAEVIGL